MNLNKKAFTLIELIATIVIIALLVSLSSAVFINVRSNVLEQEYDQVKSYIETKAAEYASSTGITTISIEDLIKEGIISPDDENFIYDPRNKEAMNCYLVVSTFEEGSYVSTIKEKIENEDGTCKSYEKSYDYSICKYDSTSNTCTIIKEDDWFNDNITLGVASKGGNLLTSEDGFSFNWLSNSGNSGTENLITTNINLISEESYKVTIAKDDIVGEAKVNIKIDKQNPTVTDIDYIKSWTNAEKELTITVSDFTGSGVLGVFVGTKEEYENSPIFDTNVNSDKYVTKKGMGTYFVWVKDKAGNVYSAKDDISKKIEITTIDTIKPVIKVNDNNLTFPIKTDYKLLDNITVSDEGGSGIKTVNAYIDDKIVSNVKSLTAGTYKVVYKVVDNAGNEAVNDEVTLKVFIPEMNLDYEEKEIEYVIPLSGKYQINLWGAQGANNGGKGAHISSEVMLNAGDILLIAVGGINGYNGGGIGAYETYNGGGATTVKLNGSYLIRAAGGGGGANGTAGGSGNGNGGASVGSGAGANGTNSGGGSSSKDYDYSCGCSTCGGGCSKYEYVESCSTCGGGCSRYAIPHCIAWGGTTGCGPNPDPSNCCAEYSYCNGWCPPCLEYADTYECNCSVVSKCTAYYPTYSCNCDTCTEDGKSGNGGSNYTASSVTIIESKNGSQSGNGKAQIKYVVE